MMLKRIMAVAGVLAFTLIISGCGQKSLVGKEIKIETDQGSVQVGGKVTLPKNFPSDVYIIDGEIMSAMSNVRSPGFQIAIKANFSSAEAKKLYETKLKEQGWKIVNSLDMGTASVVMAQKDKRQLTVTMGTEEGRDGLAVILNLVDEQFNTPNY